MCISTSLDSTMVSSETSDGLKITYEKQPTMNSSSLSRLASDSAPVMAEEAPAKRSRSQSADKTEKMGRPKKRGSNGVTTVSGPATGAGKRTSRSQHPTPPPAPTIQPGAFSSVSQQVHSKYPLVRNYKVCLLEICTILVNAEHSVFNKPKILFDTWVYITIFVMYVCRLLKNHHRVHQVTRTTVSAPCVGQKDGRVPRLL